MADPRPGQICAPCFEEQSATFLAQSWLYCPHHRVMARRRKQSDPWTLDRGVSPEKAEKHLAAALSLMSAWCKKNKTTLPEAFALMQRLFERDRENQP